MLFLDLLIFTAVWTSSAYTRAILKKSAKSEFASKLWVVSKFPSSWSVGGTESLLFGSQWIKIQKHPLLKQKWGKFAGFWSSKFRLLLCVWHVSGTLEVLREHVVCVARGECYL